MRSITIVFCVLVVLLSVNLAQARIIHIPADSSTIQKGIDGSINGDTVLVAAGRYVENIQFKHKAITVMSENGPEETTIDGDSAGAVVTIESGEDSTSVLQGFTLTRGYNEYGGGLYCDGSSPTIQNNFFVNNACYPHRGGPAIFCAYGSNLKLIGNLIYHSDGAAAVFVYVDSHARLINNTICDNNWGGLSIQENSSAYVENNIFFNNSPYGIHVSPGLPAEVYYNDVYGQELNYVDIPDQTGINGNVSVDPLFCDTSNNNYHLWVTSPCVGAGQGGATIGALGVGCSPGDANTDGVRDIADVIYLINYILKGGPAPTPFATGDCNCDGIIDLDDEVFLVNYLFNSGPPPSC